MNRLRTCLLVAFALFAAGCTLRSAIDALTSPEDRAFAQSFVDRLRRGDVKSLEPMFEPAAWQDSLAQLDQAPRLYPRSPGTTELVSFSVNTNTTNGVTASRKQYTLVTHDDTQWTTTLIQTRSDGNGPHRITGWNVEGSREMPTAYRAFKAMDGMAKGFQIGGLIVLVLIVALVTFLVRRSRRKRRDHLMGRAPGSP